MAGMKAEYQSESEPTRHPIPHPNWELWVSFVKIWEKFDHVKKTAMYDTALYLVDI